MILYYLNILKNVLKFYTPLNAQTLNSDHDGTTARFNCSKRLYSGSNLQRYELETSFPRALSKRWRNQQHLGQK